MFGLEEINNNYHEYSMAEKLFAYVIPGAEIGGILTGGSTGFMMSFVFSPCYLKGSIDVVSYAINVGFITVAGTMAGVVMGGAAGFGVGVVYLANDLYSYYTDFGG